MRSISQRVTGFHRRKSETKCFFAIFVDSKQNTKTMLGEVLHMQGLVTLPDLALKGPVDEDDTPLSGLSFPEGQVLLPEDVLPRKPQEVGNPKAEKTSAPNHQAHPVSPVLVKALDKKHCLAPREVVRCCI